MKYYLGIDLGCTNIAAGVVDEEYRIVGRGKVKTNVPRPAGELVADIVRCGQMAAQAAGLSLEEITRVGAGLPGTVDPVAGVLEYANNLYVSDLPIRSLLEEAFGLPVCVGNDASAAVVGEALAGAAKGCRDVVAVTLGTGIGGGVLIGGKLYEGFNYAAGEIGHMGIVAGGRECTCGRRGCFETYCAAPGLIRSTREAMDADQGSALWGLYRESGKISGRTAFEAMRLGDASAARVVEEYIRYLAYGVANVINIFAPEAVVMGGGVSHEGEALLGPLRQLTAKEVYAKNPQRQTKILAATLGNDAGIIGAAFLQEAMSASASGPAARA
ncbi:MAG: ROK family protein [Oscillospiraceae bacterium]|nr:ROK family protein [Oscillospiraceae bacterium]